MISWKRNYADSVTPLNEPGDEDAFTYSRRVNNRTLNDHQLVAGGRLVSGQKQKELPLQFFYT